LCTLHVTLQVALARPAFHSIQDCRCSSCEPEHAEVCPLPPRATVVSVSPIVTSRLWAAPAAMKLASRSQMPLAFTDSTASVCGEQW